MDGVIVVDKPAGCTSHDIVNRMRRIAHTRRVGHLGTLDPLATGVLPLMLNRATRLAQYFVANDKRYEAVIRFGIVTDSYDRDGNVVAETADFSLTREQVDAALGRWRGTILQTPPPVSAKKVAGVPAYKLARRNVAVELKPVEVTVHELELIDFDGCSARVRVHCTTGTYVRSIAHELGQTLGCGARLEWLRRTASGDFCVEQAHTIDELQQLGEEERLAEALIPAADLLPQLPAEFVDNITATQIRQGRDFRVSPFRVRGGRYVKAIGPDGALLAIGEAKLPNVYHPVLVL